jgi:hypothetical protein
MTTGIGPSVTTRASASTSARVACGDLHPAEPQRAAGQRAASQRAADQRAASQLAGDRSSLSLVAETGDGCRIYRHTSGQYAVCAPGSDLPARTAATLPCAYATCQDMTRMTG